MKGDFTRVSFDARKHYSRVLFQQGRVTLDADPNEQTEILLHYIRTLARDLIGPYAGPADAQGFGVSVGAEGVMIGAGRYYVDGILVENETEVPYAAQPHSRPADDDPLAGDLSKLDGRTFWFYLDVWERHVTAIDDPQIREVALNGPDTATRSQVIWQVRALEVQDEASAADGSAATRDCEAHLSELAGIGSGQLAARVDPGQQIEDPCTVSPEARYRGAENQLYRVEVHHGGAAGVASFKWSRDNGSVAAQWLGTEGSELIVSSSRGFTPGCWLELSHEELELAGVAGTLVKLIKVEGDRLTVDSGALADPASLAHNPNFRAAKIRRWDQQQRGDVTLDAGAVPLVESGDSDMHWIDLEDGIQVCFKAGGQYRSGDYWLIPARVNGGIIDWPADAEAGEDAAWRGAAGVEHHYAPLGFLHWIDEQVDVQDCRCRLRQIRQCGAPNVRVEAVRVDALKAPAPGARATPEAPVTAKRPAARKKPNTPV